MKQERNDRAAEYWKKSIKITLSVLCVWFFCSFGVGILWRDWCDAHLPKIGNAPFGFWMSQQGSILAFVLLLILYATLMGRLDKQLDQ